MYNRKRQVRECNAQIMVFDSVLKTLNVMKTKGISVQPRKDHSCAIYGKSNFSINPFNSINLY